MWRHSNGAWVGVNWGKKQSYALWARLDKRNMLPYLIIWRAFISWSKDAFIRSWIFCGGWKHQISWLDRTSSERVAQEHPGTSPTLGQPSPLLRWLSFSTLWPSDIKGWRWAAPWWRQLAGSYRLEQCKVILKKQTGGPYWIHSRGW